MGVATMICLAVSGIYTLITKEPITLTFWLFLGLSVYLDLREAGRN